MSNKRLVRVDGIDPLHCTELAKHGVIVCKVSKTLVKCILEAFNEF